MYAYALGHFFLNWPEPVYFGPAERTNGQRPKIINYNAGSSPGRSVLWLYIRVLACRRVRALPMCLLLGTDWQAATVWKTFEWFNNAVCLSPTDGVGLLQLSKPPVENSADFELYARFIC